MIRTPERTAIVEWLADYEPERTGYPDVSPRDADAICARLAGISLADFRALDERPGAWGYKVGGGREWHWKLRQVRNHYPSKLRSALA